MNSPPYPSPLPHGYGHDMTRLMAQAHAALDHAPPPTLREILAAYKSNGDGDREMLLAMLNAKAAEDQRLASLVSLHRTMLDISQQASPISQPMPNRHRCLAPFDRDYNHPAPVTYAAYSPVEDHKHRVYRRTRSRSRSPAAVHTRYISHAHPEQRGPERPSKRHRSSRSPNSAHTGACESSHAYPLSPYSSSERSDTAEYSPRSKSSMTIGNLLSTRPSHEVNGDTSRDRG